MLADLTQSTTKPTARDRGTEPQKSIATEPTLFDTPAQAVQPHPALQQLRDLDLNQLTPLAAFDALRELQEVSRLD